MRTLGNILWHFPFLGFINAAVTFLLGAILSATVVAAPVGLGLMQLGKLFLVPFGNEMVASAKAMPDKEANPAWAAYSSIVMIVWLPIGFILAALTVLQVVGLFLTIIGIPAAAALAKSIGTLFNPVGKVCVSTAMAEEIRRQEAQARLAAL